MSATIASGDFCISNVPTCKVDAISCRVQLRQLRDLGQHFGLHIIHEGVQGQGRSAAVQQQRSLSRGRRYDGGLVQFSQMAESLRLACALCVSDFNDVHLVSPV